MHEVHVRSVLAAGNGAVVVHRLLAHGLADYRLHEIDPRVAAFPWLCRRAARETFADANVAHLVADYGVMPVPGHCARVVAFHNFYIDDLHLAQAGLAQRLYYRTVMTPAVLAAVRSADRIVVVSRFLADCVHRLAPSVPVEVIYNGIDVERFVPAAATGRDRPLRVLFVGNPTRRKGFHLLSQIVARLPAGIELAYTSGLRDEKTASGTEKLIALGHVPYEEMHHLYQQADILFFPTLREGFGLCVAEAMACGLPVVSTRCSAIPELVDEGKGGFLLPPGDVAGMVSALRQLLENPELRTAMGTHNRERAVRDFDCRRMVSEYDALFREAVRR